MLIRSRSSDARTNTFRMRGHYVLRPYWLAVAVLLHVCLTTNELLVTAAVTKSNSSPVLLPLRGGGEQLPPTTKRKAAALTVKEYVAAVKKKDAEHTDKDDDNRDALDDDDTVVVTNEDDTSTLRDDSSPEEEVSTVGVKSHKKSNAVGDPDGEGSDDDDSDTDDWEDFEEDELEEIELLVDPAAQVQVEVEMLEEELQDEDDSSASSTGGGVGLRFGQRLGRRKNRNKEWRSTSATETGTKTSVGQKELLEAWSPYVYLPPNDAAVEYLTQHARTLEGASKSRLDRRTLYAGLLLEWRHAKTYRKFMQPATSQALQAALSLATQPAWRKSFPRPSGIRLYDQEADRGCTLAMQETMAMALVSTE